MKRKMSIVFIILILITLALCGCNEQSNNENEEEVKTDIEKMVGNWVVEGDPEGEYGGFYFYQNMTYEVYYYMDENQERYEYGTWKIENNQLIITRYDDKISRLYYEFTNNDNTLNFETESGVNLSYNRII